VVEIVRTDRVTFTNARAKPPVHRVLLRVGDEPVLGDVVTNVLIVPDLEALTDQRLNLVTFPTVNVGVPAARLGRCLAQKLLRYTLRRSGSRVNTRWTDLLDFLVAAASSTTSGLDIDELRRDVEIEFSHMGRSIPTDLPSPPVEWLDFWDAEMFRMSLNFGRLSAAERRINAFWAPVLNASTPYLAWNPANWAWEPSNKRGAVRSVH
jgi:hypothetical protein